VCCRRLRRRRRARVDEAKAVTGIGGGERVSRRDRRGVVVREHRYQRRGLATRREELRNAGQHRVVVAKDAAQQ
jgi:hypothetical protein